VSNINKPKNRYAVNISLAIILAGVIIPSNIVLDAVAESTFSVTPIYLGTHHVPEGSGVAASRTYPGIFWMISDSGNPAHLYAVDQSGATKRVFDVSGSANIDWEDIAIDESGRIWIGDIGDNGGGRSSYVVYRMNEPNPYGSATSVSATAYKFVYPNGSHDAEALFIWQNTPYVVQKRGVSEVYAFPTLDSSRTVTLKYVGTFKDGQMIGGADISADGRRLALINDQYNYHWIIERSASSTNIADFFNSPTKQWRINFPNQQGEAIGFLPQSYSFVVASEQGGFWKIDQTKYDPQGTTPTTTTTTTTTTATSTTTVANNPAPAGQATYTLSFQGYDYDNQGEVSVLVNNQLVSTLPAVNSYQNNNLYVSFTLDISKYVVSGVNTLTFKQNIYSSGVQNVQVTGPSGTIYSNSSSYTISDTGVQSVTYNFNIGSTSSSTTTTTTTTPPNTTPTTTTTTTTTTTAANPTLSGLPSLTLSFQGYDYDNQGEVSVLVNNQIVDNLPTSYSSQNDNAFASYSFDISKYVVSGVNTLTFKQNIYSSGMRNVQVKGSNGATYYSNSSSYTISDTGVQSVTYNFNIP
jgi:hypothetical protein